LNFVHLHLHTDYSLLDGACKISEVIERCKRYGMRAVAVTDHGNMFCAVDLYRAALKEGIHPVIGYEAYVTPHSRHTKDTRPQDLYHLTILARNTQGYRNLMRLASMAYLEGFHYKPRIDMELLSECAEGLIILSGCIKSELAVRILRGDYEGAKRLAERLCDIVGREHFFIELQRHGLDEQKRYEPYAVRLAKELGLGLVATNDVHYIDEDDAQAQDVLLCINTHKSLDDPNRMRFGSSEFYFKTPQQMCELFDDIPEAVENTLKVAEMCHAEIEFGKPHIPSFHSEDISDNIQLFRHLCEEGARRRYPDFDANEELKKRLHYEMRMIAETGFINYFLVVWDMVRFARNQGVSVGPGRGSAAGSLVAYSLGITDVDPIRYGLLFERFLNPERISMPDIDIDFSPSGRDGIINYLREKYGRESVAQIITFGTLQSRAAIRDVGRVLEIPLAEVDVIAKKIPPGTSIEKALANDPTLASLADDDTYAMLFSISKRLEGLCRHSSTHAAGVVIADKPLINYCPLYRTEGEVTTQYPMGALEAIGLMKMDILGLTTLDVIEHSEREIRKQGGEVRFDDLTDGKTYSLLQKGDTKGVFQLESDGMRSLLTQIKPKRFEDLIDILALFRPGPLNSGMVESYIKRRNGREKIEYLHPELKGILQQTFGVVLYQEQVMQIANRLAGFSLTEADHLRKAMGKKIMGIVEEYEEKFIEGAMERKVPRNIAEKIYSQMAEFARYGFNKSHSAAYAMLSYRTAYLKANYPLHFMAALLSSEEGNPDKIWEYIEDCLRMGITVLPPDINRSLADFSVERDAIRFGLAAIKNVGRGVAEEIVRRRTQGEYRSIYDLCERLDMRSCNRQVLEALIKAGALDSVGGNRAQLLASLEAAMASGAARQRDARIGQKNLFQSAPEKEGVELPPVPPPSEMQLLAMEKEVFGFYFTSHPLTQHRDKISIFSNATLSDLKNIKENRPVIVGVVVENITRKRSKRGSNYLQLSISDLSGSADAVVFEKSIERLEPILKKDRALFIVGSVDNRQNRPSIIVSDAVLFEDAAERLEGEISIRVQGNEETFSALRRVVENNPGKTRIRLLVVDGEKEAVLRLPRRFSVSPTEKFIKKVESIPGVTVNMR